MNRERLYPINQHMKGLSHQLRETSKYTVSHSDEMCACVQDSYVTTSMMQLAGIIQSVAPKEVDLKACQLD